MNPLYRRAIAQGILGLAFFVAIIFISAGSGG
jgi:hypothetical protein